MEKAQTPASIYPHAAMPAPGTILSWADVTGINYQKGLDRFLGKVDVYEEKLYDFEDTYTSLVKEMGDLLEQGDLEEASKLCHTMKGSCGNLAIDDLFELSEGILDRCKADDCVGALEVFHQLEPRFQQTVQAIVQLRDQREQYVESQHSKEVDHHYLRCVLEEFAVTWQEDLDEALDRLVDIDNLVEGTCFKAPYDRLSYAFDNFDAIGIDEAIANFFDSINKSV